MHTGLCEVLTSLWSINSLICHVVLHTLIVGSHGTCVVIDYWQLDKDDRNKDFARFGKEWNCYWKWFERGDCHWLEVMISISSIITAWFWFISHFFISVTSVNVYQHKCHTGIHRGDWRMLSSLKLCTTIECKIYFSVIPMMIRKTKRRRKMGKTMRKSQRWFHLEHMWVELIVIFPLLRYRQSTRCSMIMLWILLKLNGMYCFSVSVCH